MRCRVVFADRRVEATPDDFAVAHHHGADRNLAKAFSRTRQRQGFAHEKFVLHRLFCLVFVVVDVGRRKLEATDDAFDLRSNIDDWNATVAQGH